MFKLSNLTPALGRLVSSAKTTPAQPAQPFTSATPFGIFARDTFVPARGLLGAALQFPNPSPQLSAVEQQWLSNLERAPQPPFGKKQLDVLREDPGFKALAPDTQTRVMQTFLHQAAEVGPQAFYANDHFASLMKLVQGPGLRALPPSQQQFVVGTFQRAGTEGKQALAELGSRMVAGKPALASTDSAGATLAVRLSLLSSSPAADRFLDSTLKELARPETISAAVDAKTQATHQQLARTQPAELVRVLTDLATTQMSTLANGKTTLDLRPTWPFDFKPVARRDASPSEVLFQRAVFGHDAKAFRRD